MDISITCHGCGETKPKHQAWPTKKTPLTFAAIEPIFLAFPAGKVFSHYEGHGLEVALFAEQFAFVQENVLQKTTGVMTEKLVSFIR